MKKFTLVEMLIVIAIIGVLVSILLPSLTNARKRTRSVVCMSNQKQLGAAMLLHVKDNSLRLPLSSSASNTNWAGLGNNQNWKLRLNKYLGYPENEVPVNEDTGENVFSCPSRNLEASNIKGGIGWNLRYLPHDETSNDPNITEDYRGFPIGKLDEPQDTIAIGDTVDNDSFINKSLWRHNGSINNVATRHFVGGNYLFTDGHVTSMKANTILSGKNGFSHYWLMFDKENDRYPR